MKEYWINDNGISRKMTEDEAAENERWGEAFSAQTEAHTPDQRIAALERAVLCMMEKIQNV